MSRPVEIIERGEGKGGTLYACRPCRATHGLTSLPTWLARAALIVHLGGTDDVKPCGPCNRYEACAVGGELRAAVRREREADK
ncbi:hypothetical protein ABZ690_21200 [Streptomyces sp. NPDC006967]|uniref:hypothetical protein n=1 Tax=unclassified Streptomyces TaxID=2593676 RepID=UPI0033CC9E15